LCSSVACPDTPGRAHLHTAPTPLSLFRQPAGSLPLWITHTTKGERAVPSIVGWPEYTLPTNTKHRLHFLLRYNINTHTYINKQVWFDQQTLITAPTHLPFFEVKARGRQTRMTTTVVTVTDRPMMLLPLSTQTDRLVSCDTDASTAYYHAETHRRVRPCLANFFAGFGSGS
jgi:hypothetical protein